MTGENGFEVYLDRVPNTCSSIYDLVFSESASRYILGTDDRDGVHKILSVIEGLKYSEIGIATSKGSDAILYHRKMEGSVTLSHESIIRSVWKIRKYHGTEFNELTRPWRKFVSAGARHHYCGIPLIIL